MEERAKTKPPRISVVIPVLNEAKTIALTLGAVARLSNVLETIVVDGGSSDETLSRAELHEVRVITSACGRGKQMHAGALAASGAVLWFLHADTLPPPHAAMHIATALTESATIGGTFEVRFSGEFLSARFLTWLYHHLAIIGLRYGDSGYFVRREEYMAIGGFRPYPIFEDLDLLRRLRRRGRFVRVPGIVTTSSRRFEGRFFAVVFARWMLLQVLYWIGFPPGLLGRFYRHIRLPGRPKGRGSNTSTGKEREDVKVAT